MTRRRLHQTVVEEIGSRIVNGTLREGDVLIEADLGEQVGISRSGVRECARRSRSWRPGDWSSPARRSAPRSGRGPNGTCWTPISFGGGAAAKTEGFTRAVYDVRKLIESGAAALAAERATDLAIARIAAVFKAMVAHVDDIDDAIRADRDFPSPSWRPLRTISFARWVR